MVPHLLPASRSFAGVWASFGQVPRAGWSHWGASGAVRGRMQLGQAQKPAVLGDRGYKLCPSLLELCDPLCNLFSFDGTMVIYSTNALIQNMMDHGTQIKI